MSEDEPGRLSPSEEYLGIVAAAWADYHDPRQMVSIEEISANVSTNRVYRVTLEDETEVIAKTSSYGSYVHFRQDHRIIHQWIRHLGGTRFRRFLARMWLKDGEVYSYREGNAWVVFYKKAPFYDFLPKILTEEQVDSLATEMAEFHVASAQAAPGLTPSWKTLGSDVASLFDALGNPAWRAERGFPDRVETELRRQCDVFFTNAERLGYHQFEKIPVLIDWNIGNFSVGFDARGFKFFTRWDYDWFRVEPRTLDFYFCARVVRAEGDKTVFSYNVDPYFDPRFLRFLRIYHSINPLSDEEILFLKEAYRAFLLVYVVRTGEHFFRQDICQRLQQEALDQHFPRLDETDFSPLLRAIHG